MNGVLVVEVQTSVIGLSPFKEEIARNIESHRKIPDNLEMTLPGNFGATSVL